MAIHPLLSTLTQQSDEVLLDPVARTTFDRVIDLAEVLASPVILPIALIWLTHRFSRKQAEAAAAAALQDEEARERRKRETSDDDSLLDRHKRLIAVLYQLLSDVQLRHVRAQCSDLDENECVGLDNDEFQARIQAAQEQLSAEYLFVGSAVINRLYEFISELTEMMVTLQRLKLSDESDKRVLETTAIFETAERAADILTSLQQDLVSQQETRFKSEFEPEAVPQVRNCCGQPPTAAQRKRFAGYRAKAVADRDERAAAAAVEVAGAPPKTGHG